MQTHRLSGMLVVQTHCFWSKGHGKHPSPLSGPKLEHSGWALPRTLRYMYSVLAHRMHIVHSYNYVNSAFAMVQAVAIVKLSEWLSYPDDFVHKPIHDKEVRPPWATWSSYPSGSHASFTCKCTSAYFARQCLMGGEIMSGHVTV